MTKPESIWSVRTAQLADAQQIAAIHEKSRVRGYEGLMDWALLNTTPFSERKANWVKQLNEAESLGKEIFVAEIDGRPVGFAVIGPEEGADLHSEIAELDRIYVHPDHWNKGIGKILFRSCLGWLQARRQYKLLRLWTIGTNVRARRFYESLGFAFDGQTRSFGPYPEGVRYSVELAKLYSQ